ncbi:hypothetical protein [Haloplasma contractile]|nr:hypothetical protein [Haloplasma contractile]
MVIKSKVQGIHDEEIKSFKYDKKVIDNRRFYIFEYDLSDGRSCIAYLNNGKDRLVFTELGLAFDVNRQCYEEKPGSDINTIDVYYHYKKGKDYIDFVVFGYNNGRYDEFLITFNWGTKISVPISNEQGTFFSY